MKIVLDGESLSPDTLWSFSRLALDPLVKPQIEIAASAEARIQRASEMVARIAQGKEAVYGINTGFGKFAEVSISREQLDQLQLNLIRSHAVGTGAPLSRDLVMAMWVIRLNTICRGNSGVRLEIVKKIIASLERGLLAEVPSRGSVGASGDLAPSAHATLALLGEGKCSIPDSAGKAFATMPASDALKKLNLDPIRLGAKEGLSLINGTQLTTALALKGWFDGRRFLGWANAAASLSIEGLKGSHQIVHEKVLASRNQPGALTCGHHMAKLLGGETEISRSHEDCGQVQDPYSLRCAPQVHGAIYDALKRAEDVIRGEINASTDNPVIFPETNESVSGGNFHAIYTARVSDELASAMSTLSSICERRIALAMSPESSKLPAFLIKDGGLNSGFMMAQVTAAALVSESKTLSFPASVDSIPTSGDREDHVSMGPTAGHKLLQIVDNTCGVIAIELMAGCQEIDLLRPLKTSQALEKIHAAIRKVVKPLDVDRFLAPDLEAIRVLIQNHSVEDIAT